MWHDAWLVAGRDLRIEARSKVAIWQVMPFALLSLLLFAFALGPRRSLLASAASGLFWLALLFSAVLAAQRAQAIEGSSSTRQLTRLLGLDPAGIFLGKAAALALQLLALEAVLLVGIIFFFHVSVSSWWLVAVTVVLAAVGLAAISALYGAVSGDARVRATLLPLLVLPIAAPVLIAGSRSFSSALGQAALVDGARWLAVLGVFAVIYVVLGATLYGPLEDD